MSWNRNLWGVEMSTARDSPILLGQAWHTQNHPAFYAGEPTRALLFDTRKQARAWCVQKLSGWIGKGWRLTPVRVIETVRKVP
jgi:hypothetical protein